MVRSLLLENLTSKTPEALHFLSWPFAKPGKIRDKVLSGFHLSKRCISLSFTGLNKKNRVQNAFNFISGSKIAKKRCFLLRHAYGKWCAAWEKNNIPLRMQRGLLLESRCLRDYVIKKWSHNSQYSTFSEFLNTPLKNSKCAFF